jgi:uncharacterized protein (TIGR02597 family)
MKSFISYSFLAAVAATSLALGETAVTIPVGYTTTVCPANSDTIVGLPLRQSAAATGALSSAPTISGSTAVLSASSASYTPSAYVGSYYVKFKSGSSAGKWFPVTANTATSLTVDLNGDTLAATSLDTFEVLKFWTLAELFNPATATTDATTTPHAIVASLTNLTGGRRTQVLIPNLVAAGTNIAPATNYYIHDSVWKKAGAGDTSFNNDQLWPDSYFIIRNPSSVTAATKYVSAGEVELNPFTVSLGTRAAGQQDNFVGIPRPVDVTLDALALGGTAAFTSSTSTLTGGRRDQLLVFNNAAVAQNKAPVTNYYFHDGIWKKAGGGDSNFGSDVIPAGSGFIIRKYNDAAGVTTFWKNTASY